MPLHNIAEHRSCMYYATDETSLFKQYCLSGGESVSGINDTRSALLYLTEGSLRVRLGRYSPCKVECGTLLFLRKNTGFNVQAIGTCRFVACFLSGQLPLCSKYGIEDSQYDTPRFADHQIPPPTDRSRS